MNVCVCVKGVEKENIVQYIFFWRFFSLPRVSDNNRMCECWNIDMATT